MPETTRTAEDIDRMLIKLLRYRRARKGSGPLQGLTHSVNFLLDERLAITRAAR